MDAYEATKIVFSRIQSLDPENASKIMGLLLIQDHGDKEMIRLAFGPESLLHSLVLKAKKELSLVPNSTPSTPLSPFPFISSSRHHHNTTNSNLTNTSNNISTSSSCVSSASSSSLSSTSSSSTTRLLGVGSHLSHSLSMPSASWAAAPTFLRGVGTGCDGVDDSGACRNQTQAEDPLISPNSSASCPINVGPHTHSFSSSSNSTSSTPFYAGGRDLIDELQLQDQLSFLNDTSFGSSSKINSLSGSDQDPFFYPPESPAASPGEGGMFFPYAATWGPSGTQHRRSCFLADVDLLAAGAGGTGFGWKPCLYYARGYCKNGTSCRFLHGPPDPSPDAAAAKQMDGVVDHCQELLRSRSQRLGASTQLISPPSPASFSLPNSNKCMNFLLQEQHQHNDPQSPLATAAAALMLGDDPYKVGSQAIMRMERSDFAGPEMVNPGSRQIYLTFPADSTFREEDVSNYFSIYGPVQDVRIPYQQKRMFGFVTFVYPETVKLILAKGNPHFVCDARVLVKPYKEKGKVPDKKQQQQAERGDSSTMPTGLDPRDLYDLQQLGARMLYNNSQEIVLRRKLEEQQADLQHALELQGRRLMGLQLLDVKRRNLSTNSPLPSPDSFNRVYRGSPDLIQENSPSPAASISPSADNESCFNDIRNGDEPRNPDEFQESGKHNLPDSPFASPTKCSGETSSIFSSEAAAAAASSTGDRSSAAINSATTTSTDNLIAASSLFPATSCFFQMPRLSSGHGAIEM